MSTMPADKYQDYEEGTIMIQCSCGSSFPFSPGEQKFYAERGLFPPKRCPMCRLQRKQKFKETDAKTES